MSLIYLDKELDCNKTTLRKAFAFYILVLFFPNLNRLTLNECSVSATDFLNKRLHSYPVKLTLFLEAEKTKHFFMHAL